MNPFRLKGKPFKMKGREAKPRAGGQAEDLIKAYFFKLFEAKGSENLIKA